MSQIALDRLKQFNCLFFIIAAASLFLSGDAFAAEPHKDSLGACYGSVEVTKINMVSLEKDVFQMIYSGSYQEFYNLQNEYESVGTVYYRLGENGNWSTEIPALKSVGDYDIYYYVIGDLIHNDLASALNPMKIKISVVDWGAKVENNGITNYVDPSGRTSAEIDKNDIVWLKEESDGSSAWYGLDNSNGVFEKGLRFWVRWLNKNSDPEEFDKYYNCLDEAHRKAVGDGKAWIFLVGVVDQDGNEYTNFGNEINFYIELGEDWDKDNINAVFISEGNDEVLDVAHVDNFNCPEGGNTFAKVKLRHFSPYLIYDELGNDAVSGADNICIEKNISNEELEFVGKGEVPKFDKSPQTSDSSLEYFVIFSLALISFVVVLFMLWDKRIRTRYKRVSRRF